MDIAFIFWLGMLALVVWQLVNGVILDKRWKPWFRRDTQPLGFWVSILIQLAMLTTIAIVWTSSTKGRGK